MKMWLCLVLCMFLLMGLISGCSFANLLPDKKSKDNASPNSDTSSSSNTSIKVDTEFVRRNTEFAFKIFNQLNEEDEENNIFISPISISTALAMTYQGAETTTKEAMAKVLEYYDMDIEILNEDYKNLLQHLTKLDKKIELNMANSIWIREGEPVNEDFLLINKKFYDALIKELDFSKNEAADIINHWISDTTNKKITEMIEPPISPDTLMYLINAVYFKGQWTRKFDKKNTYSAVFHAEDGSTQEVMMMTLDAEAEYGQGTDFQVVRLPYGNGHIAMYCILPKEGVSINDFTKSLNREKWDNIKSTIEEEDNVVVNLPRFKLEYGIKSLKDSLKALGMKEAFSDMADFSGIRNDVYIHDVFHKAVIEVNEEGSEAAAATVVEMRVTSVAEPIIFSADRPFIFVIADDNTGTILFIGKVHHLKID